MVLRRDVQCRIRLQRPYCAAHQASGGHPREHALQRMAMGEVVDRAEILGADIQVAGYMLHRIQDIAVGKLQFPGVVVQPGPPYRRRVWCGSFYD